MAAQLVYMTMGSEEEARSVGRELVNTRLAACVNMIDRMRSIYRWEGDIQEDREVVLIAKTTDDRLSALVEKVKSMHSYDCPCIVGLPVSGGNRAFLDWIADEVN